MVRHTVHASDQQRVNGSQSRSVHAQDRDRHHPGQEILGRHRPGEQLDVADAPVQVKAMHRAAVVGRNPVLLSYDDPRRRASPSRIRRASRTCVDADRSRTFVKQTVPEPAATRGLRK